MRYSTKCSTLLIVLLAALAAPLLLRADGSGHGLKEAATTIAALHRQADAMQRTDPQGASQVLEQGLGLPLPPGDAARTLRADLHARIAQLKLLARDAQGSLEVARAGLAEAGVRADALTAQLRLREGEALEALGRDDEAVEAYGQVIAVGKKVLEDLGVKRRGP